MGRNRGAVSELFEVGRQNAAILQAEPPLVIDSRDRHDFAVRCAKRSVPAIGRQDEPVARSNFDCSPIENIEGFCLFLCQDKDLATLFCGPRFGSPRPWLPPPFRVFGYRLLACESRGT